MKTINATKALHLNIVSNQREEHTEKTHVPMYRVRANHPQFMAWAERNEQLRGVIEIRVVGDDPPMTELVRLQSDA